MATAQEAPKAVEVDCVTGETTERFLTEAEIESMKEANAQFEADRKKQEEAAAKKEIARNSAMNKLAELGLSTEEINALTK